MEKAALTERLAPKEELEVVAESVALVEIDGAPAGVDGHVQQAPVADLGQDRRHQRANAVVAVLLADHDGLDVAEPPVQRLVAGQAFREMQPSDADHVPVDFGDERQVFLRVGGDPIGVCRELVRSDASQLRKASPRPPQQISERPAAMAGGLRGSCRCPR